MKLLKVLLNPRIVSAIVSAVSAVICATLAGCKLAFGKISVEDFESTIYTLTNTNYWSHS